MQKQIAKFMLAFILVYVVVVEVLTVARCVDWKPEIKSKSNQ